MYKWDTWSVPQRGDSLRKKKSVGLDKRDEVTCPKSPRKLGGKRKEQDLHLFYSQFCPPKQNYLGLSAFESLPINLIAMCIIVKLLGSKSPKSSDSVSFSVFPIPQLLPSGSPPQICHPYSFF